MRFYAFKKSYFYTFYYSSFSERSNARNEGGIVFDSILLDWLLFILIFLVLIAIGYLIRFYIYSKSDRDLTPKPSFTKRKSLRRGSSGYRGSRRPSSLYSNQDGKNVEYDTNKNWSIAIKQNFYIIELIDSCKIELLFTGGARPSICVVTSENEDISNSNKNRSILKISSNTLRSNPSNHQDKRNERKFSQWLSIWWINMC